jgi:flagellar hook assembly protein FlgD
LRVEAKDGKNNSSGTVPYQIQFTIKNETSLTISDPYPNPFSTSLFFKIVITGDNVPDAFDMQVITANGKLVTHYANYRDVPFHVGTNLLAWDGTDQGGNKLPGGVYIYKMMIYIKDKIVEKIGKVVLVP